jgi:hypothetical protein
MILLRSNNGSLSPASRPTTLGTAINSRSFPVAVLGEGNGEVVDFDFELDRDKPWVAWTWWLCEDVPAWSSERIVGSSMAAAERWLLMLRLPLWCGETR